MEDGEQRTCQNSQEQSMMNTRDMGYRRIKDELKQTHDQNVNDKRVLRICREEKIQSSIKHPANSITKRGRHPYYVAENILNRDFSATAPNTKWVTDITEFKYYIGSEVHKVESLTAPS